MDVPSYISNIIKDYLTDRSIETSTGFRREYRVGVPQGSVIGPTLWNVLYDEIFKLNLPNDTTLIGYADDIAIVAEHKDWETAIQNTEAAVTVINNWLTSVGLQLAPEKTESVALKYGRRKREGIIQVVGCDIEISQVVKYLGVELDTSVSFGPHVRTVAAKAQQAVAALAKIMPNIGGPGEERRKTLAAVGQSILLYAAPVWAGAMGVALYRRTFQSVHRTLSLRVCRGYRTISYDAAMVISSMIPIHLLVEERRRLWNRGTPTNAEKKEEREITLANWQHEWDRSEKGRWTSRLIRQIKPWVTRGHGRVGFHLTQWLSGHGSFQTYKHRIGKSNNEDCSVCGETDTPEHVAFHCPLWTESRTATSARVGEDISANTIIGEMLRSKKNWEIIEEFIVKIMISKDLAERRS